MRKLIHREVNNKMKVLVVDDEKLIVKGLKFALEKNSYEVVCAYDGEEALAMVKQENPDIILLDVMLPKLTGFEVCEAVRTFSDVPIIMLTAKGEYEDRIEGFDHGADDYVTKPFNVQEVLVRIKAILKRTGGNKSPNNDNQKVSDDVIIAGEVRLELSGRRMYINDKEYNLTPKEFEVMALLCSNPNIIFSREKLLTIVWGNGYPGDVRTVDVTIRRLREKIEPNAGDPKYVHTKWGDGYYFKA